MKMFDYANPTTVDEASSILKKENAALLAGGTDLVGELKADLRPVSPDKVVSMKNIEGLDYIREEAGKLRIGAMTQLDDIADSPILKDGWAALAKAAYSVASPGIRSTATLGGNLCQETRCWYYRYPHEIGGRVECLRKDGKNCYAMLGENRYHSIFGGCKVGKTPCSRECPAGTDIPAYMARLREGDVEGAAYIIMKVNPMPAITSRVCAHFCQEDCNRALYDEQLNIGSVERYVGDYILDNYKKFMAPPEKENGKQVAIIGSGPGGLAAAFYLRQSGYKVVVYERMAKAGGALTYAIPAYRLPKDIVDKFVSILGEMGVEFKLNTTIGEKLTIEQLRADYDSVMLDTGTWKRPLIGISGEELTRFGLDFLVAVNSYMDERPGANVVVVGGGNVAVDVAVTAKRLGAKKVTMICLEQPDEMPAGKEEVERVHESGCELVNGWGPKGVIKKGGKLSGVEFKKCTKVYGAGGRFDPEYDEGTTQTFDADVVFMAVGQVADLGFLEGEFKVETERGRIKLADGHATNIPGLYAAGDVTSGPATVIEAIKTGEDTAKQMNAWLGGDALVVERIDLAGEGEQQFSDMLKFNKDYSTMVKYHRPDELPPEQRDMEKEDVKGLSKEEALAEAERCINCSCVAPNPSDMANILVAMDATVRTNMRSLPIEQLYSATRISDVLNKGEILLEIEVPKPAKGSVVKYEKFRMRDAIDFAIAAVAWSCSFDGGKVSEARLVLGAAAPAPMRAREAEKFLIGKTLNEKTAAEAAEIALKGALPLPNNEYKIDIFKTYIKRTIM